MSTAQMTAEALRTQAAAELKQAAGAWAEGNAGMARVCSRRAAGMGIRAWLNERPDAPQARAYGTNFMHHLRALADDTSMPEAPREAAWRLAARPIPEGGWQVPVVATLTPMDDATALLTYLGTR